MTTADAKAMRLLTVRGFGDPGDGDGDVSGNGGQLHRKAFYGQTESGTCAHTCQVTLLREACTQQSCPGLAQFIGICSAAISGGYVVGGLGSPPAEVLMRVGRAEPRAGPCHAVEKVLVVGVPRVEECALAVGLAIPAVVHKDHLQVNALLNGLPPTRGP